MLEKEFFEENRKKFIEQLPEQSLCLIYSGKEIPQSLDQNYPFYTDNNYYYLTGLQEPNGLLTFYKDKNGDTKTRLFIPRADQDKEKWVGYRYSPEQAKSISGIDAVLYEDQGEEYVYELTKDSDLKLCLDRSQPPHQWYFSDKEEPENVEIIDISSLLMRQRLIKNETEIEAIKRAAEITAKAIEEVRSILRPGEPEKRFSNYFDYLIKEYGADGNSFETIAASGPNGPILHYVKNDREVQENDLILFDLGARLDGYCADVSRTYPVSGTFTPLQEKFYKAALESQKQIISLYKAGAKLKEIQEETKQILAENLLKQGIQIPKEGITQWYYHSIGHSLGLDTHDGNERDLTLEDGMVITCEPGLYAQEYDIGIRIEDDILIHGDQPIVLTESIPKEIDEILS